MKTKLTVIILTINLLVSCANNTYYTGKEIEGTREFQNAEIHKLSGDSILNNVENRIQNAFIVSLTLQNPEGLLKIKEQLEQVNHQKKNSIVAYWLVYAHYYQGVYYFTSKQNKDSETAINKGIGILEQMEKKQSEHYALLSLMQNFSIQFVPAGKAAKISEMAKENGNRALELDNKNLRAYYTLALNDFYTPKMFGGGKLTETYCKKAVGLDKQSLANPYLPSWGKNLAYELLIRHYIKTEDYGLAKKTFKEAVALYPNDYLLNQLASQLVDK